MFSSRYRSHAVFPLVFNRSSVDSRAIAGWRCPTWKSFLFVCACARFGYHARVSTMTPYCVTASTGYPEITHGLPHPGLLSIQFTKTQQGLNKLCTQEHIETLYIYTCECIYICALRCPRLLSAVRCMTHSIIQTLSRLRYIILCAL